MSYIANYGANMLANLGPIAAGGAAVAVPTLVLPGSLYRFYAVLPPYAWGAAAGYVASPPGESEMYSILKGAAGATLTVYVLSRVL